MQPVSLAQFGADEPPLRVATRSWPFAPEADVPPPTQPRRSEDLPLARTQTLAVHFNLLRRGPSSTSRALVQNPGMLKSQAILSQRMGPQSWYSYLHIHELSEGRIPPTRTSLDVCVECQERRPVTLSQILERPAGSPVANLRA